MGLLSPQRRTTLLGMETSTGFIIDATVSEEHAINVQTTEHPVERGFAITDHRRVQPKTLKLTGMITNYPVKFFASAGGATNYVTAAWDAFNRLKESGELVSITTSLQTYDNMMITDVSVPRDAKRGNSLEFTVTAKELRIVDSEDVVAPTIDTPVQEEPKPAAKNVGVKTPAPPAPATLQSAAKAIGTKGLDTVAGSVKSLLPI